MEDLRNKAIYLMKKQQYDEALPLFLDLINKNPNDPWLYYMAGQCFRFTNDMSNAIKFLEKATEIEVEEFEFWHALGIAYQLGGDYVRAVEAFHEAILVNENAISSYNSMGLTYRKLGEYQKAVEWYEKGIKIHEKAVKYKVDHDPEIKERYKELYEDKKSFVYPLLDYIEEFRKDPMQCMLFNNLGVALMELGQIEEAQAKFEDSISFIPDNYIYYDPYDNLLKVKDIIIEDLKRRK